MQNPLLWSNNSAQITDVNINSVEQGLVPNETGIVGRNPYALVPSYCLVLRFNGGVAGDLLTTLMRIHL